MALFTCIALNCLLILVYVNLFLIVDFNVYALMFVCFLACVSGFSWSCFCEFWLSYVGFSCFGGCLCSLLYSWLLILVWGLLRFVVWTLCLIVCACFS